MVIMDGVVTIPETLGFLGLYAIYLMILFRWDSIVNGRESLVDVVQEEIKEEHQRTGIYFRITHLISRAIGLLTGDEVATIRDGLERARADADQRRSRAAAGAAFMKGWGWPTQVARLLEVINGRVG